MVLPIRRPRAPRSVQGLALLLVLGVVPFAWGQGALRDRETLLVAASSPDHAAQAAALNAVWSQGQKHPWAPGQRWVWRGSAASWRAWVDRQGPPRVNAWVGVQVELAWTGASPSDLQRVQRWLKSTGMRQVSPRLGSQEALHRPLACLQTGVQKVKKRLL